MDDYEQVRVIGRGAFGVCWLCRCRKDNRKVIVKKINIHGLSETEENSIKGEVKLLQKVQHPLIIGYYDSFSFESQLAIVMQYAEGGTMERMIQEQRPEKFAEKQVLDYFTQILIALNHMHSKQIVHRDLKPQNILMNRRKTIVKLSDFGISKELSTKSAASTVIGTPNYLSPEICEGRSYNQKSDMWSLGCVLFELLELKRAFDGENLPAIVMKITKGSMNKMGDHVSPEVQDLVGRLLQTNDKARPDVTDLLVHPTVLPALISIHCDLGRLDAPSDKRKPSSSLSSRLRITPTTTMTMRSPSSSLSLTTTATTKNFFATNSNISTTNTNRIKVPPAVTVTKY